MHTLAKYLTKQIGARVVCRRFCSFDKDSHLSLHQLFFCQTIGISNNCQTKKLAGDYSKLKSISYFCGKMNFYDKKLRQF